ncbi:MAG: leucyl aminopeptidase [Propioniciclava sp.]|nr:leucyl aminopeptidase [Propioniciclava sp.]
MQPTDAVPLRIEPLDSAPLDQPYDCLVLGLAEGDELGATAAAVDAAQGGWITRGLAAGTLKSKRGELVLVPAPAQSGPATVLLVGLGDTDLLDRGKTFELGAAMLRRLVDRQRAHVVIALDDAIAAEHHDALISGAVTACAGQALYQAEAAIHPPQQIGIVGVSAASIKRGLTVGQSINLTRRLVNEPPNILYPETFAEAARRVAEETGLSIEVWDETRLEAEGCRAILAVGGASAHPPRLVILRHRGGAEDDPLLAIVGKGVTFDSGGLSIKPSEGMLDMKCDMAGAATVLGVMRAAAMLELPINLVGICGLAENMISGSAYRLGDVIETRSGTTIEIHNTDAEGRVVLADTLDVAVQHQPTAIIDLATLTGACMVALGRDVAGLMSNDSLLCEQIAQAAADEGEWAWELPMFDFYDEQVKSKVADLKNVGDGRWGGAITAAKFLQRFVDGTPWVHIDIAGPVFADSPKPHRDAGGTGVMVRTLIRWLQGSH